MIEIPDSLGLEVEVLGIALHSKEKFADIMTAVKADWFIHDPVSRVYQCAVKQFESGNAHDPLTVARILMENKDVEAVNIVTQAKDQFISAERADFLIKKLYDYHLRRVYYRVGMELQEKALDPSVKAEELVEKVESEVLSIVSAQENKEFVTAKDAAIHALDLFYQRASSDSIGITFSPKSFRGLPGLDIATAGGLKGGDLVIIAAQTGEGKTAMALNLAALASIHQSHKTYYQNTEMRQEEMVYRLVSNLTGVPFAEVYTGKLAGTPDERTKKQRLIETGHNLVHNSQITFSELPELSPGMSKALARKFKLKNGKLDLLVIDYAGRMEMDDTMRKTGLQEWQIMARIAKESKKLAQQLDCAVILLAQLNEEGKLEGAKKMMNDADLVLFIEKLSDEEKRSYPDATHWLRKRKVRRSGKDRDILIRFDKPIQRISEVYFSE